MLNFVKIFIEVDYSNIRKLIDQKGITFKFFCDKIGMSPQGFEPAIQKKTVAARVLIKMSEILEIPVSSFFDEIEPVHDPKDSEIIELQRKYIARLEAQLDVYEGRTRKRAG